MITVKGNSAIYEGPTIDEMYTTGIDVNTLFHELNTNKWYYLTADTTWVEVPNTGGGGSSFTPTEEQLAAMNSGITATDVQQISTNKNNISKFHKAANTDIYFSETEPTGTITEGSYWISAANGVKTFTSSNVSFDTSTDLKGAYLVELTDNRCEYRTTDSTSRTLVIPCSANAQYIVSVNSKTLRCAIYSTIPTNNSVSAAYAIDNLTEYSDHSVTVKSPSNGAYIAVCCYLSNVESSDGKTIDEIFGTMTIIEKKWS